MQIPSRRNPDAFSHCRRKQPDQIVDPRIVDCPPSSSRMTLVAAAHTRSKVDRSVLKRRPGLAVPVQVVELEWSLHSAVDKECSRMALQEVP